MDINWKLVLEFGLEILIATGALGAIFGIIRRGWLWFVNDRAKAEVYRVLIRKYSLYDMMQATLSYVGGQRIVLLRLENGGNIPSVTKPLHTTCVEESYNPPLKSLKQAWQSRLVDMDYIKRIISLGKNRLSIHTDDIEDDALLKNLYLSNKIIDSELFYVSTTNKYLFYLSINFVKEKKLNPTEINRIYELVNSIRQII